MTTVRLEMITPCNHEVSLFPQLSSMQSARKRVSQFNHRNMLTIECHRAEPCVPLSLCCLPLSLTIRMFLKFECISANYGTSILAPQEPVGVVGNSQARFTTFISRLGDN